MPVKVFCSYAREDLSLREELAIGLQPLVREHLIELVFDEQILPGDDWVSWVEKNIDGAAVVLLLVSPHFIASENCRKELAYARTRSHIVLIPILLSDCEWQRHFSDVHVIPFGAKPLVKFPSRVKALNDVAREVERRIRSLAPRVRKNARELVTGLIRAFPKPFIARNGLNAPVLETVVDPASLPPVFYHWRFFDDEAPEMHWIDFAHLLVLRRVTDAGFPVELLILDTPLGQTAQHANTELITNGIWRDAPLATPVLRWYSGVFDELSEILRFARDNGFTRDASIHLRDLMQTTKQVDPNLDHWLQVVIYDSRFARRCIVYVRALHRDLYEHLRTVPDAVRPAFVYRGDYGSGTNLGKEHEVGGTLVVKPPHYDALLQFLGKKDATPDAVSELARYLTLDEPLAGSDEEVLHRAADLLAPHQKLSSALGSRRRDGRWRAGALALVDAMTRWNERYFAPQATA